MARSEDGNADVAESREDALLGRAIGKYTLTRVIGRGGMGIVFEAQNTTIGKRVAVKLVASDLAKNKDAVLRFQREAQAASAVESAHIVDIFDAGTTDEGVPFIVMELLRGEDLGHRIRRMGRLELADALHLTAQLLRGLSRAHAAGIIHRDLKPDNVFLVDRDDDQAFVKILDFGISKVARTGATPVQTLTKEGTVLGTPFYMAPEQAQGLPEIDGRADLWSVGAILYECLTGRAPHTGASYEQVIVNICSKDADDVRAHNPAVPEAVALVLAKALGRAREDRFDSARDFLEAVAAASGGVVTLSPRSSDETPFPPRSGSSPSSPSGDAARAVSGNVWDSGSHDGRSSSPRGASSSVPSSGAKQSSQGFDDTVELRGGSPSRVGWATNGGVTVRRDRRRILLVGLGALALGSIAAISLATRKPDPADPRPAEHASTLVGAGAGAEVTIKLRANVEGARFIVDGRQIAGGVLRGPRGETRKILVEAEGFTPVEAIVTFEPGQDPPPLFLSPSSLSPGPTSVALAPSVAPGAGPASAGAPGSGAFDTDPKGGSKQAVFRNGPLPSTKPSAGPSALPAPSSAPIASTAPPAPTAAPTAAPAPTLTIKLD